MPLFEYGYSNMELVNLPALTEQIRAGSIQVALDHCVYEVSESKVIAWFKSELASEDVGWLDAIMEDHDGNPLTKPAPTFTVNFPKGTTEDEIPYVYSTSKPLDYMTYFTSLGDDMTNPDLSAGRGKGDCIMFNLKSSESEKTVDVQFNQDVYLKDGLIHISNAPFGATLDIDAIHPYYGFVDTFGRGIPLMGDGWIPLDTEDKASVPKGLIIRLTVRNSDGSNNTDASADFKVAGRLELYRPKLNKL
jgi:hypothetical protein